MSRSRKADLWAFTIGTFAVCLFFMCVVPGAAGIGAVFMLVPLSTGGILVGRMYHKHEKQVKFRAQAVSRISALPVPDIEPDRETPGNGIIELPISRYE